MTILRSRQVVLPDGVRAVDIEIRDGRITAITDSAHAPHGISGVIDAGDLKASDICTGKFEKLCADAGIS